MGRIKLKNGVKWICNECGFTSKSLDKFNDYPNENTIYCLKCRPIRMTYRQLIEWLAKGNGYLCQQAKPYTIAPTFTMLPVIINEEHYPGKFDDQIPYNEHELVVSRFESGFSNWEIPTLEMYNRDCKGGKK